MINHEWIQWAESVGGLDKAIGLCLPLWSCGGSLPAREVWQPNLQHRNEMKWVSSSNVRMNVCQQTLGRLWIVASEPLSKHDRKSMRIKMNQQQQHPSTSTQFWRTECSYPLGQLGSTALLCSTRRQSVSGGAVSRHATPASQHDRGCSSRGSSHLRRPMVNDSLLGSGTLHRLLRAQGGTGQVLTWRNAPTVLRRIPAVPRWGSNMKAWDRQIWCIFTVVSWSVQCSGYPWMPNLYTCPNENEELIHCWH